jgi:hypothetical protein
MHGVGVLFLSNGEKFHGIFSEGAIHGAGSYTTLDSKIVKGVWD